MSVFADFVLECGLPRIEELPARGKPWSGAWESQSSRLRISQPLRDVPVVTHAPSATCPLWALGEIEEYEGRPGSTEQCLLAFQRDLAEAQEKPESLSGRFLLLAWCVRDRTWQIFTDRVGSIHCYLTQTQDGCVLGSFSGAIYSYSQRQLDWEGLSTFFTLGFFLSDSTFYRDCRVLRPATRIEVAESGTILRQSPYWRWTHTPCHQRGADETIREFGDILTKVVAAQCRTGRIVLPLSGGLDSRTVAACLPAGSGVSSYSYGYREDSVEICLSGQIAEASGLPFTGHVVKPYLFAQLPQVLDAVEGFQDLTQTRQASLSEWLGSRAEFVLGAHWGDVLCDSMDIPAHASAAAATAKVYAKLLKNGSSWLSEHLCAPNLPGVSVGECIQSRVQSEFSHLESIEDADFRAKVLKTTQWAFRWTLPSVRAYQLGAVPRLPFLHSRVLDFFCTVPTRMLQQRRLQIEYLKRFAPRLASVVWQAYDADLFHYQHFNTWQLPRRAWRRVQRAYGGNPVPLRNWEIQFRSPGMAAQLRSTILDTDSIAHQFVARQPLLQLLEEFERQPTGANGYTVSMLFTFCAWARRFHSNKG